MQATLLITALLITTCSGMIRVSPMSGSSGIRFEIDDEPGISLVSVHYSVNKPLSGVEAGQWNFDIRAKTAMLPLGDMWIHENKLVSLKPGDEVNYWIYMIKNSLGKQVLDRKFTVETPVPVDDRVKPVQPADPVAPVQPADPVAPVQPSQPDSPSPQTVPGDQRLTGRTLRLVLEDTFDGPLDKSKWNQEVSLWGGGNWEFQAYTNLPDNTFTKDGKLFIKPSLTADKYGESFLTTGRWDMKEKYGVCTQSASWGCLREGKHGVLNPVLSGRLMSKATITYGKVEIVAKLPRGDWIWPALWMYPQTHSYGGWPRSGEIDIMESRGNRHFGNLGIEYFGTTLHWGTEHVNKFQMTADHTKARSKTLADGLHKYTFYWDQQGMDFYLDNEKVTSFPTPNQGFFRWGNLPGNNIWSHANNAPFDKPFYLIMNVAVGGTNGFFPDGVNNAGYAKPWSNKDSNGPEKFWKSKNQWYPTWQGDDAAMQIESVRIWQLE